MTQILVCCSYWKNESSYQFSAPGVQPLPRKPLWKVWKMLYFTHLKKFMSRLLKQLILIQRPIFSRFFFKVLLNNNRNTLASNPYFSLFLKRNTVRSKSGRSKKYAQNLNLKLSTFSDRDLKVLLKTFIMRVAELHLVT